MPLYPPQPSLGVTTTPSAPFVSAGSWTPAITFTTPGDLSVAYTTRYGRYIRQGNLIFLRCNLLTSTFTHTTASGSLLITGLPVTAATTSANDVMTGGSVLFEGITKVGYTQITPYLLSASSSIGFFAGGTAQVNSSVTSANVPTATTKALSFQLVYEV